MKRLATDFKYTYEVHFPNTKERFYSDLGTREFLNLFNKPGGVETTDGDLVVAPRVDGAVGRMICYIKQVSNHKPF